MASARASDLRIWRLSVLCATAVALVLLALSPLCAGAEGEGQTSRGFEETATSGSNVHNGDYYALVIGIDDYSAPLHQLKTAVNDARAVGQLLHDRYDFKVEYLLNGDATRYKILSALGKFRASLHVNDNLLIYYGGHGYFDHDTDKAYWLPVDADSGMSPNTIMADDLTSVLRALPSRHVLVVSDSCYSGGLSRDADGPIRTGGSATLLEKELSSRSRTLMASGGLEPVADAGGSGHSVFASAFLRGLQEAEDPSFTAIDLFYTSIRRQVAGRSSQLPEYSTLRNSGDDEGDFVFSRKIANSSPSRPTKSPAEKAYDEGYALWKDHHHAESLPLLASACEGGIALGCRYAARLYEDGGNGVAIDFSLAEKYSRLACDGGNATGCVNLGILYANGNAVAKDDAQAVALYKMACDGGSASGCSNLGVHYLNGTGVGKDAALAESYFRKTVALASTGCNGADGISCFSLGQSYHSGHGVSKDDAQAAVFYQKACDEGEERACTALANLYLDGNGVSKDEARAASLFRQGCDEGAIKSCGSLGFMYENGKGVGKNMVQAVSLYQKGCDEGEAYGCASLGNLYRTGDGVAKDEALAVNLFRKGCDGGNAAGCGALGYMMELGEGIVADKAQAIGFYRKGCTGGNTSACANLKRFEP